MYKKFSSGKPAPSCVINHKSNFSSELNLATVLKSGFNSQSFINLFHLSEAEQHIQTFCALTHFTAFFCNLYDSLQFFVTLKFCLCVFQCAGFMMTLKGLPSTYNKDLQVCLCVLSPHGKHSFSGYFLSNFFVMLSLSFSSFLRRIRRPCLTAMILFMLCCR